MFSLRGIITPQAVAIALISMLLFGGMMAVDSISVTKYSDFVKHSNLDIQVVLSRYKENNMYPTISKEKVNSVINTLESYSFVKNITTFSQIFVFAYPDNASAPIDKITGITQDSFSYLNISITSGAFADNAVAIREDIFSALNLSLGDYLNVSCSHSSGIKFLLLPIVGTFRINNTVLSDSFKAITTINTLTKILIPRAHPFYVRTSVVADIDDGIINPANPEQARATLFSLEDSFWSLTDESTDVYVNFYLLNSLMRFIEWKSEFRQAVFLSLLPVIAVFWFVEYYLIEMYFGKKRREIDVMVARGFSREVKTGMFLKFFGKETIVGTVIGAILGIPMSRVFLVAPKGFLTYASINMQASGVPYILSMTSLIYIFQYLLLTLIAGIFFYGITRLYTNTIRKMLKKKKGILKKLLVIFGGSYIDFILLGYSFFIFLFLFLNLDLLSQIQLLYNPLLIALLFFAPLAFIIGAVRVIFRVVEYIVNPIAYCIKNLRRLYPVYLGIKNLTRKGSLAPAIGMIFALVIALSQTSGVVAQTYIPSIRAYNYWLYGSDYLIEFQLWHPNLTLISEVENYLCKNISSIVSHTVMLQTRESLTGIAYLNLIGINPQSFAKTIYTDKGKLFGSSPYVNKMYSLQNVSNGAIISKFVSDQLDLREDDVLRIFSWRAGFLVNMRIVGVIDYKFSSLIFGYSGIYGAYYTPPPVAPSIFGPGHSSYTITYLTDYNYVLTTYSIIEALNESITVAINVRVNHNANTTKIYNILQNRITNLKYKYLFFQNARLGSGRIDFENALKNPMLQTQYSILNINFAVSLTILLIVLWELGSLLRKKRSREIAILIALGEHRSSIALTILFELFFTLLYGAFIGLVASYPFSIIVGRILGIDLLLIADSLFSTGFAWLAIGNVFYALSFSILLGFVVLYMVLHIDESRLLKIEWSPEKLIEEIEVA